MIRISKKFLLLVLIVIGAFVLFSVIGGKAGTGKETFKVTCDVDIKNPFYIGSPKIDNLNCVRKTCGFFDKTFSLFSSSGNAQLVVGNDVVASSSYKVGEGGTEKVTLSSICVSENYGAVILRNENNVEIDRKGFTL